jgi:3'-5' exoribonuclease
VGAFTEPLTKYVAEEILIKHGAMVAAYKRAPAAKIIHNAWYGGLLEHVWSLCHMAKPIVAHYQSRYCEKISLDKVIFGLMLHDAGKVIEYNIDNPAFPLTARGLFANHIVLGPAWVYEKSNSWWNGDNQKTNNPEWGAERFKLEQAHLMHILAAHHGEIDWGSPVVPASLEALLVHHLDNLDAKMMHAWELIERGDGEIPGFSERSWFNKTHYFRYTDSAKKLLTK